MSGGTDHGAHGNHARHRRIAGGSAWTPTLPPGADDDTLPGRHVARLADRNRLGDNVPAPRSGNLLLGQPAAADPETFPNMRPAKHEAAVSGRAPAAVHRPVEYVGAGYDPLTDTGASGLRKFDLGSVPASVTPPRSWRRAAWFSVAASAAALAGLVAVSSAFVGGSTRSTIGALPGLPQNTALPPSPPPEKNAAPAPGAAPPEGAATSTQLPHPERAGPNAVASPSARRQAAAGTPGAGAAGTQHPATGGSSGISAITGTSTDSPDAPTSTVEPPTSSERTAVAEPPPENTDTTYERSLVHSPDAMDGPEADRTATDFYDEVEDDPASALAANASPDMSRAERASIRGRYADVEYVRVHTREVNENERTAVNTMTLYYPDGSTREATRTLEFSEGDNPKIVSES